MQDLGEVARGQSAGGPEGDGAGGLLAHEMLEALLSLDLRAFQHPPCLCDVDYLCGMVLSQTCRHAGGGAALWRAHGIDGATLSMSRRVEAACVMACMRVRASGWVMHGAS
jgi:hypothetical protein